MTDILADTISNNLKTTIAKQTQDVHDALVTHHECIKMEEELFVGYFLPHFCNKVPISTQPAIIAQWISIAGSPMSEVDVIDRAGEILYTVPSLFDTSIINVAERKVGDSIADISAEFDLRNNNIPAVAQTFLRNQLQRKLSIVNKHVNDTAQQRWQLIFTRYGIESPTIQPMATVDPGDDLEYD